MRKHIISNTCIHLGHEVNFSQSWWCNKQFEEPTEIHKGCKCSECPDFKAYEWDEITSDISTNSVPFIRAWSFKKTCSLCKKEIEDLDSVSFGAQYFCKECIKKIEDDAEREDRSEYPSNNDFLKKQEFERKYGHPIADFMATGKFKWEKENEN